MIDERFEQPAKGCPTIFVTELEIVTEDRLLQEAKAASSIVVTALGIVTDVIPVFIKAPLPIYSTEFPIITDVSFLQL